MAQFINQSNARLDTIRNKPHTNNKNEQMPRVIYNGFEFGGKIPVTLLLKKLCLDDVVQIRDDYWDGDIVMPDVEFDFYNKVDLIRYFMRCENVDVSLRNTLHERLLKNIEILYYLTSPSKKMLKDMGIYDGDIDQIVAVIGENFTSIAELQLLLKDHIGELGEISVVSRYIINRLLT